MNLGLNYGLPTYIQKSVLFNAVYMLVARLMLASGLNSISWKFVINNEFIIDIL